MRKAEMHARAKNFRRRSSQKICPKEPSCLGDGTVDRSKAPEPATYAAYAAGERQRPKQWEQKPLDHNDGGAYSPALTIDKQLEKRIDDVFPSRHPFRGTD